MKLEFGREINILVGIALLFGLVFAQPVLFPLFIVFFLYLLLNPLHEWMVRWKIPSTLASAILVLLLLCLIITGITFLVDPATEWIQKAPEFFQTVQHKEVLAKPLEKINQATQIAAKITDVQESDSLKISIKGLANSLFSLTSSAIVFIFTLLILLFFTLTYLKFFIQKLEHFIYKKKELHEDSRLFIHIRNDLSRYLYVFSFICMGLGFTMFLVFWIFGLPNPFLWGVMVSVLTFIPYFGHFTGIIIIFLVSLITFDSWFQVIMPAAIYLVASGLEGQVITPLLLGNRLNLNPLLIILSMFFWGAIWGIGGVIISIPLLIIIKISLEHIPSMTRYASLFEK